MAIPAKLFTVQTSQTRCCEQEEGPGFHKNWDNPPALEMQWGLNSIIQSRQNFPGTKLEETVEPEKSLNFRLYRDLGRNMENPWKRLQGAWIVGKKGESHSTTLHKNVIPSSSSMSPFSAGSRCPHTPVRDTATADKTDLRETWGGLNPAQHPPSSSKGSEMQKKAFPDKTKSSCTLHFWFFMVEIDLSGKSHCWGSSSIPRL